MQLNKHIEHFTGNALIVLTRLQITNQSSYLSPQTPNETYCVRECFVVSLRNDSMPLALI